MASIIVQDLTFAYPNSYDNIFENVSFTIDTNWKLGFIGRNGRGKTTFLNLLMDKYKYSGKIISQTKFEYFPYTIKNPEQNSYEIAGEVKPEIVENYEEWKLEREVSLLDMDVDILKRQFNTLSKGEQTRIMLAILFANDTDFLLIDEPTNHLDSKTRAVVANYLNTKKGFILVSHDRLFVDTCVDHILSINKANIEIQKGNFSSWLENKRRQDSFELRENERLLDDIKRLEQSAKQSARFAQQSEAGKFRDTSQSDNRVDKGFVGKRAAKIMKRSTLAQSRKEQAIREKSKLLKNIEVAEDLKMNPLEYRGNNLVSANNLQIVYDDQEIFDPMSFTIEKGDIIHLKGDNGSGKSSIIKLILGKDIDYKGDLHIGSNLKISYVSQDTTGLKGNLSVFAQENGIDETLFKSILSKLDFDKIQFEKDIETFSEGQKKKVLIAKSLCEEAHLYLWDEPLNYIDILSRVQIEDAILEYAPTMLFVEHDELFAENVATKTVEIENETIKTKEQSSEKSDEKESEIDLKDITQDEPEEDLQEYTQKKTLNERIEEKENVFNETFWESEGDVFEKNFFEEEKKDVSKQNKDQNDFERE